MKKKILFILHVPPPVHGAAVMGKYITESEVINNQFDTDYINLTTSFELTSIGKGKWSKLSTIFRIWKKVVSALMNKNYDLCYMTLTSSGAGFYKDVLIVLTLKAFRKKIVYHFHNKGVHSSSQNIFNSSLYRMVFHKTKSILLSPKLYNDISKYVQEKNVLYCPNGIPDSSLPQRVTNDSATCRFLFLSNMMEKKGVLVLLKACQHLKNRKLPFECHFIGAPSDISESLFKQTVEKYGIEAHVFFHGKKYGSDKVQFFKNADVFVFPTYYDCFPLVLLEAMQYSLPIISTFEGAIASMIVNGETGILNQQKDDVELANTMEKMGSDKILREKMGEAGRKRYEQMFTLKHFESNLATILEKYTL